jgi:hypothetical protein
VGQVRDARKVVRVALVCLELVGRFTVQDVVALLFDLGKLSLQGTYGVLTLFDLPLQLLIL